MRNSLKYDPLQTFRTGDERSRTLDNLISLKIEDDLQLKIDSLMKQLIDEQEEEKIENLKMILRNTIKDKEDAQRTREINIKKSNGVPILRR